jgi:hypothetical protein
MLLEGLGQLKKSSYLIGIRNRDLPDCSIVPQPTTLPRAPRFTGRTDEIEDNPQSEYLVSAEIRNVRVSLKYKSEEEPAEQMLLGA